MKMILGFFAMVSFANVAIAAPTRVLKVERESRFGADRHIYTVAFETCRAFPTLNREVKKISNTLLEVKLILPKEDCAKPRISRAFQVYDSDLKSNQMNPATTKIEFIF